VVTLLCTVHGCRLPLRREERRVVCRRGHSFDVARSGYVNLLQPQDRKARQPGDSAKVLAARRRFLGSPAAAPLLEAIVDLPTIGEADAALEVGCGDGQHLARLAERSGCEGHGVDISVAAIDAAAKQHPRLGWVVANADRFLPYDDASFRVVLSVTSRMNPPEFRRVLRPDGMLLVAIPAPDDLVELRRAALGMAVLRDRVERTVATFTPHFTLERQTRVRHVARLDATAAADAMMSAYRAVRTRQRARLTAIRDVDVTLSRDVLIFRPAPPGMT
jgi:23S rRNA (guanine745-N1)-methyltransferase